MNPYLLAGALVFFAVSHSWAYYEGSKHTANEYKAEQLELQAKLNEAAEKQAEYDQNIALAESKTQESVKIVYRTIREKVNDNNEKNRGYGDCSLDADGLSIYNYNPATKKAIASIAAN